MNYLLINAQLCCKMALWLVLLAINSQQVSAELPLLDCPGPGCPSVNQNQSIEFRNPTSVRTTSIRIRDPSSVGFRNPNRGKDEIAVYFHNLCTMTIYGSIHFKDNTGEWKTISDKVLKKGEKILLAQTTGDLIYLYAESELINAPQVNNDSSEKKAKLKWGGKNKFLQIKAGEDKVGFFQKKIESENTKDWVEVFECD